MQSLALTMIIFYGLTMVPYIVPYYSETLALIIILILWQRYLNIEKSQINNIRAENIINFNGLAFLSPILLWYMIRIFESGINAYPNLKFFIFAILVIFFSSIISHKKFARHIVYISTFISILSIISWVLFNLFGDHVFGGYVNLSVLSDGAITRDLTFGDKSYFAPLFLSLIDNFGTPETFYGFSYSRATGWSHEPVTATIMPAIAIILLVTTKKELTKSFKLKIFLLLSNFGLLIIASSLTPFLALVLTFLITLLLNDNTLKIILFFLLVIFISILIMYLNLGASLEISILSNRLSIENSESLKHLLSNFLWFRELPNHKNYGLTLLMNSTLWFQILVFYIMSITALIIKEKRFLVERSLILSLIYIMTHSMKGIQDSIFTYGIVIMICAFVIGTFSKLRMEIRNGHNWLS